MKTFENYDAEDGTYRRSDTLVDGHLMREYEAWYASDGVTLLGTQITTWTPKFYLSEVTDVQS
jgi:hypothetical protein